MLPVSAVIMYRNVNWSAPKGPVPAPSDERPCETAYRVCRKAHEALPEPGNAPIELQKAAPLLIRGLYYSTLVRPVDVTVVGCVSNMAVVRCISAISTSILNNRIILIG